MKQNSLTLPLVGGGIAFLSFFLPWVKFDRTLIPRMVENPGPDVFTTSGFGTGGLLVILAFLSALAILGCSFYMLNQKTPWKSRTPVLISSGIGFLCVVLTLFLFNRSLNSSMQKMSNTLESIGFEETFEKAISLQFGGFGAAVGFIVTLIGAWNIPKSDISMEDNEQEVVT